MAHPTTDRIRGATRGSGTKLPGTGNLPQTVRGGAVGRRRSTGVRAAPAAPTALPPTPRAPLLDRGIDIANAPFAGRLPDLSALRAAQAAQAPQRMAAPAPVLHPSIPPPAPSPGNLSDLANQGAIDIGRLGQRGQPRFAPPGSRPFPGNQPTPISPGGGATQDVRAQTLQAIQRLRDGFPGLEESQDPLLRNLMNGTIDFQTFLRLRRIQGAGAPQAATFGLNAGGQRGAGRGVGASFAGGLGPPRPSFTPFPGAVGGSGGSRGGVAPIGGAGLPRR